ncbi:MAG: DEAD/DEAH box helicase [Phycisphaeraceae bacterium]|nr:DEAD/DEAH box helicase [Phycisphaeraceae bacterium]
MIVLHANWTAGGLHVWGESAAMWKGGAVGEPGLHPFAVPSDELRGLLGDGDPGTVKLVLPSAGGVPRASSRLAHAAGVASDRAGGELKEFEIPTVVFGPERLEAVLEDLESRFGDESHEGLLHRPVVLADSVLFFASAARLARHLLAQQRFVPALRQEATGDLKGTWHPWMNDAGSTGRVAALVEAMPASARAVVDEFEHRPWAVLEDCIGAMVDAECRRTLIRETVPEAIAERDPAQDPQVAWLSGLLGAERGVPIKGPSRTEVIKGVRRWIAGLEERGASAVWRLLIRLSEPANAAVLGDMEEPGEGVSWPLTFHLQSVDSPRIVVDASDVWLLSADAMTIEGKRLESPQELLLAELGRASRVYSALEKALDESEPESLELNTRQAYQFLREQKPVLMEQGFGVEAPEWWDQPSARLGARLKLTSEALEVMDALNPAGGGGAAGRRMGLSSLVNYTWDIAIGGTTLSLAEFEKLAGRKTPLVRINGRWVEVRPEDVKAAIRFIRDNPGGTMRVGDAIHLAYGADAREAGIPIVGLEATGWVSSFFGENIASEQIPVIDPPAGFHGSLRPYQVRGLSWLAFLEKFGFGPCLADDMGLGKTIQLLALLVMEREAAQRRVSQAARDGAPDGQSDSLPAPASGGGSARPSAEEAADAAAVRSERSLVPPTLLVVPMSVVGNWVHEARRFCPQLKFILHHGVERMQSDAFVEAAENADAVITTYALAHRDRETLQRVNWQRVVLDEAQYIKNPGTKQAIAVRSLPSTTRIALTGTPVENRLSELWSILDFLNPGYLGPAATFRKRFSVPVERYHDATRSRQLRELVRPFVLRRLKTDPNVAADLPEKVETREYCHLTSEQAELYERIVGQMMAVVDAAEGIQRRGLVLATLVKLKQVCNHPGQYLKEWNESEPGLVSPSRSGKCVRMVELLSEVMAAGDQALVFTQFRQMGGMLAAMLRQELDRDVLFFHGGTPQGQRQAMVDQFQRADGKSPILIVSLKAGGVGLNLTAATHVFHFDRWWNPAVENQATDRAHRIGQYRTVQVHKFVVRGTLEERIDEMIEAKTELAENIIGSGESWLTELSTDALKEVLTLRRDAVGDEE